MALNLPHLSTKHIQLNKANNQLAFIVAAAVVVSVFCLVSAKSLLSQAGYQRRVLAVKHQAANQLQANLTAAHDLVNQYNVFEGQNPNVLGGVGGSNPGTGAQDGDNARIALDALPSQYDFPALISSLEKILNADHVSIQGIGGTDEGQVAAPPAGSTAQPVPMTFSVDAQTDYPGARKLVQSFENSIRPIDINTLEMDGTDKTMHISVSATTYYQPATTFSVNEQEVN